MRHQQCVVNTVENRSRPKPAGRLKVLGVETGCLQEERQRERESVPGGRRDVARQLQQQPAGQWLQSRQGRAAKMRETTTT